MTAQRTTCYLCRRRIFESKAERGRCVDREACSRAMARYISRGGLTPAEREAKRYAREDT